MRFLISLLYILFFFYLKFHAKKDSQSYESPSFQIPAIINSMYPDSVKPIKHYQCRLSRASSWFVGKFKFSDSIDINPDQGYLHYEEDIIWGLESSSSTKEFDSNGFDIIVDYNNDVPFWSYEYPELKVGSYFPIYVINNGPSDKLFFIKDSYASAIQEAKSPSDNWYPIEGRGASSCSADWGLIIKPTEFAVVLMSKYEGDYETEMRVRLKIGENIYISKSFLGHINQDQFQSEYVNLTGYEPTLSDYHHIFTEWYYSAEPAWIR